MDNLPLKDLERGTQLKCSSIVLSILANEHVEWNGFIGKIFKALIQGTKREKKT